MEIWTDIPKFNNEYQVSNLGKFRSKDAVIIKTNGVKYTRKGKILKFVLNGSGYKCGAISFNGKIQPFSYHRIIAETFIPNPENKETVNHINGIKTDNRVENLEWNTRSENIRHAYQNGLSKPMVGSLNGMAKLNEKQVKEIREYVKTKGRYYGRKALAEKYGVSECTIKGVVTRRKNKFYNVTD